MNSEMTSQDLIHIFKLKLSQKNSEMNSHDLIKNFGLKLSHE